MRSSRGRAFQAGRTGKGRDPEAGPCLEGSRAVEEASVAGTG